MRRKIPSTMALAAFEAAARHQSFTLAGEELALTQSAVGRQVANLEAQLGVKLFRRTKRGVVLTESGQHYSRTIRNRLDDVERDTLDLMARAGGAGSLDLGVVPTFATHWLLPRLARFRQLQPQLTIHLHARSRPFLFEEEKLDAAIYAGATPWPGTTAVRLMPEPMRVVCAPRLAGARRRLTAAQVAELPLIQMSTRPYAWREWFQAQGLAPEHALSGPRMELFSMVVQAALHGMGAALVPQFFVEDEMRKGVLVSAGPVFLSGRSYYLSYPQQDAARAELVAFGKWLATEAELYASSPPDGRPARKTRPS
ncbi:LysR family transcriptional regulator [Ramlibacter solisilvae]|uniref:LysR substrate-binding domain-containing protein n=1 Tax=Ramlibacter tataouinensis TaxID=94132 RepID=UPI0007770FD4|nr:LysR substrate-binding domain-containing protein [Ramlibacter tataouinensis]